MFAQDSKLTWQKAAEFLVIAAVFFLPISTAMLEISILAAVFCWAVHSVRYGYPIELIKKNSIAWLFLAFFCLFLLGSSYTEASSTAVCTMLLKYKKFLLVFFLFPLLAGERMAYRCTIALLSSIVLTLFLSYSQYFLEPLFHKNFQDSGVFKDHIFTGFLFAFASYSFTLLFIFTKRWRWLFGLLSLLTIYNVFFINLGRSAYPVFVALTCLLGWQLTRWKGLSLAVLIVGLILGNVTLFSHAFKQRSLEGLHNIQDYEQHKKKITSLGLRLSFYQNSFQLIKAHPFFGYGTASFEKNYARTTHYGPDTRNPHNEYLNITVQFGLFGLSILLLLFYIHALESTHLPKLQGFFAQAVLVSIATGSLVNSWLMDVTQGYFYVLLTAISFANLVRYKRKVDSNATPVDFRQQTAKFS